MKRKAFHMTVFNMGGGVYNEMVKKLIKIIGVLGAVVSLGLNFYFQQKLSHFKKTQGKYKVERVLDGDSFVIDLDRTVRFASVNTPEVELCYGEKAKQGLEELILGKYVEIENQGRDHYGRTIAFVYLNNQSINEIIVQKGWGKYSRAGAKNKEKRDLIKKISQQSKEKKIGVWSPQCYQKENLENPECLIKGNIGKSGGKKIYHFPGCNEYERTVVELDLGEEWFCTEEAARKAGYKRSEHCYGEYGS